MFIAPENRKLWVYHPEKQPKIVERKEFKALESEGWADTPAPFLKYEQIGLDRQKIDDGDTDERLKADQILQTVADLAKYLNGAINLDHMKKDELMDFAALHFDVDMKKSRTKKHMINKIRGLMSDDG